jgi:hypothetical protein
MEMSTLRNCLTFGMTFRGIVSDTAYERISRPLEIKLGKVTTRSEESRIGTGMGTVIHRDLDVSRTYKTVLTQQTR